jgi:hypothetical protein
MLYCYCQSIQYVICYIKNYIFYGTGTHRHVSGFHISNNLIWFYSDSGGDASTDNVSSIHSEEKDNSGNFSKYPYRVVIFMCVHRSLFYFTCFFHQLRRMCPSPATRLRYQSVTRTRNSQGIFLATRLSSSNLFSWYCRLKLY